MRYYLLFVVCALSACNTPTPQFYGVSPIEMRIDGSHYRVFHARDRAQVIRTNAEWRPNVDAEEKITQAIEIATGCTVAGRLKGDVVLANARVDCGSGARPWPAEVELLIECDAHGVSVRRIYCTAS